MSEPPHGETTSEPDHAGSVHALLDTNVILDWLLSRMPWSDEAQPLWHAQSEGLLGYVPASAVTDVFYIARRSKDLPTAFTCIDRLLAALEILPVGSAILYTARASTGSDFEDNVQIACAQAANLDIIVTRDTADFAHAPLPAVAPPDIIRYLPEQHER